MAFNRSRFLKEIRVFVLVALFIFLLSFFGLFSQTVDFVLSFQSMEASSYMEYLDSNYNKNNNEEIKETITRLENEELDNLKKRIYVLDKDTSTLITSSTGISSENTKSRIDNELSAQTNRDFIFIDFHCCRTADLDHYKILVQVESFPVYEQFFDRALTFAGKSLAILLVVILVLFVLRFKILGDKRRVNIVVSSIVMFCFVATFSLQALQTELNGLDTLSYQEKETVISDLNYVCNGEYNGKIADLEFLEKIAKDLTNNSISIQEIKFKNIESFKANGVTAGAYDIENSVEITQDTDAIQNKKMNFYIKAALMLLLAFILIVELYAKRGSAYIDRQENKGISPVSLSKNDIKLKHILFVVGVASAGFTLVNVLRIREVAMLNWTENVSLMIDLIFTITLIATVVSSFFSSVILKKCGSIKKYILTVCAMCLIGAFLCGSSNNPIIFVIGLVVLNTGTATVKMTDNFYTTLIDDIKRKDRCYIELDSGRSIGEVVGNIAGGVISVMASYAFVQILVGIIFLGVVVYTLSLKAPAVKKSEVDTTSFKEIFGSLKNVLKSKDTTLYLLCLVVPGSIPYMLIEYKLPLDVAALGLSAIVLSFIKVVASMVNAYSMPLYHVVSRHLNPLDHALIHRLICISVVLVYLLNTSVFMMVITIALIGFLNGIGTYAVTKTFRELPDNQEVPEADRFVALRVISKAGDTITPTLFSTIHNPFVLAGLGFAAPLIYYVNNKCKKLQGR